MLVWQDMPNGAIPDPGYWQTMSYSDGQALRDGTRVSEQWKTYFKDEWKEIITSLYSYPSIVSWVPFNEAWWQFDTRQITDYTRDLDKQGYVDNTGRFQHVSGGRLINSWSGGNFFSGIGDFLDVHNYNWPGGAWTSGYVFSRSSALHREGLEYTPETMKNDFDHSFLDENSPMISTHEVLSAIETIFLKFA